MLQAAPMDPLSLPPWALLLLMMGTVFMKEMVGLVRSSFEKRKPAAERAAKAFAECGAHDLAEVLKDTATEQRATAEAMRGILAVLSRHDSEERNFQLRTEGRLTAIATKLDGAQCQRRGGA